MDLLTIFTISVAIITYGSASNANSINLDSDNPALTWIEEHAATVTGIGIIVTISLFIIERYLKHISNIKKRISENFDYLSMTYVEVSLIFGLFQKPRLKEHAFEIYDFEFPTNIYDRIQSTPEIRKGIAFGSTIMIMDFYSSIILRNKLWWHRKEARNNHLDKPDSTSCLTCKYISDLDCKVNEYEEQVKNTHVNLLEALGVDIDTIVRKKKSKRTTFGLWLS